MVTGGSRGIGAAVATLAAARGYAVAVVYRSAQRQAADLVAAIGGAGGKAKAFQADVADAAAVDRLFADVDRSLGTPTALVVKLMR